MRLEIDIIQFEGDKKLAFSGEMQNVEQRTFKCPEKKIREYKERIVNLCEVRRISLLCHFQTFPKNQMLFYLILFQS